MRRVLFILAGIGYLIFLGRAFLPSMSIYYDLPVWLLMGGCALVALVCSSRRSRLVASIALLFAVAGTAYCYRYNTDRHARLMQEIQEQQARHAGTQTETNR